MDLTLITGSSEERNSCEALKCILSLLNTQVSPHGWIYSLLLPRIAHYECRCVCVCTRMCICEYVSVNRCDFLNCIRNWHRMLWCTSQIPLHKCHRCLGVLLKDGPQESALFGNFQDGRGSRWMESPLSNWSTSGCKKPDSSPQLGTSMKDHQAPNAPWGWLRPSLGSHWSSVSSST